MTPVGGVYDVPSPSRLDRVNKLVHRRGAALIAAINIISMTKRLDQKDSDEHRSGYYFIMRQRWRRWVF